MPPPSPWASLVRASPHLMRRAKTAPRRGPSPGGATGRLRGRGTTGRRSTCTAGAGASRGGAQAASRASITACLGTRARCRISARCARAQPFVCTAVPAHMLIRRGITPVSLSCSHGPSKHAVSNESQPCLLTSRTRSLVCQTGWNDFVPLSHAQADITAARAFDDCIGDSRILPSQPRRRRRHSYTLWPHVATRHRECVRQSGSSLQRVERRRMNESMRLRNVLLVLLFLTLTDRKRTNEAQRTYPSPKVLTCPSERSIWFLCSSRFGSARVSCPRLIFGNPYLSFVTARQRRDLHGDAPWPSRETHAPHTSILTW